MIMFGFEFAFKLDERNMEFIDVTMTAANYTDVESGDPIGI